MQKEIPAWMVNFRRRIRYNHENTIKDAVEGLASQMAEGTAVASEGIVVQEE